MFERRVLAIGNQRLVLVPSDLSLEVTSLGIVNCIGREILLKQALSTLKADYILIDCSPSLGLLTINALVAADRVWCRCRPSSWDYAAWLCSGRPSNR